MVEEHVDRFPWRTNPNAVELGFEFYLRIIERRLRGEEVSMVQSLRDYFRQELQIDLRETQARGLMHRDSPVFAEYVKAVSGQDFTPGIQYWEVRGLEGFLEWRIQFLEAQNTVAEELADEVDDIFRKRDMSEEETREWIQRRTECRNSPPLRRTRTGSQIIRDSMLSYLLKSIYDYQCQICRFSFRVPSGAMYAEAHHVRPLGGGHEGLDIESNMMVLCPTHHALMDCRTIAVHPESLAIISIDEGVLEIGRRLEVVRHQINPEFLEYHLEHLYDRVH